MSAEDVHSAADSTLTRRKVSTIEMLERTQDINAAHLTNHAIVFHDRVTTVTVFEKALSNGENAVVDLNRLDIG